MTATMPATCLDWEAVARAGMHPLAVDILTLIESAEGEWTPKELAEALEHDLGTTSYHVRQLAARGLLKMVRTEPRRGALSHFYILTDAAVA